MTNEELAELVARQDGLKAEIARLDTIVVAADTLRERVRAWCTIPLRPGEEEAWEIATNMAEDAVMEAADAYDEVRNANLG